MFSLIHVGEERKSYISYTYNLMMNKHDMNLRTQILISEVKMKEFDNDAIKHEIFYEEVNKKLTI